MSRLLPTTEEWTGWRLDLVAIFVLLVGFLIRLWGATSSFVNPDEAYHALLSSPDNFRDLYASAVRSPHPPLFVILLHYIRQATTSDLGIRLIPLVAGTIMPWVMYRWIGRGWSKAAGLGALAILALTPELIQNSVEARAYTLALLAMAAALYLMDLAIEEGSVLKMVGFAAALYVAILSDFSAAFFVLASGVYFLTRIAEKRVTTGVRITWELSQVGAIVLYAILWVTQVDPLRSITGSRSDVEGWLREAYLQPGQNPLVFAVQNTAKQFAFVFPLSELPPAVGWLTAVPAAAAMLVFGAGLWLLWRKSPPETIWHSRATVLLMVVPFAAACAAACVQLFPYGRTRHTVFLALFIAAGVSIAVDKIGRRWIVPLVLLAAVAAPVWHAVEGRYKWDVGRIENKKEHMEEALAFLKKSVPPGAVVLTESELRVVLAYYLDRGVRLPEVNGTPSEERAGDFNLFCGRWAFGTEDDLRNDLRLMRGTYGLGPEARIWVLDGGFLPLLQPVFRGLHEKGELPDVFEFGWAAHAVLTPPGFLWEEPGPADRVVPKEPGEDDFRPAVPAYR